MDILSDSRFRARARDLVQRLSGPNARQRKNFRTLDPQAEDHLKNLLAGWILDPSDTNDLYSELHGRLNEDRWTVIPWLDTAMPLFGAHILEIGCGTGASTVALAEQGAHVVGIDVHEPSLTIARDRCALYKMPAALHLCNAMELPPEIAGGTFDMVLFFATLEHMTLSERTQSLRQAFAILRPGGLLGIIEAPNRLWFYDGHSSFANFYHWLPDELAIEHARRSKRSILADAVNVKGHEGIGLARFGRGVSYHDVELALGECPIVISNKTDFMRRRSPTLRLHAILSGKRRYERFLERLEPGINRGFFREYLDVLIQKPIRNDDFQNQASGLVE
ncbi:MAG: class I SAM-dependent methyltransferase [Acidiphilium sp.]